MYFPLRQNKSSTIPDVNQCQGKREERAGSGKGSSLFESLFRSNLGNMYFEEGF